MKKDIDVIREVVRLHLPAIEVRQYRVVHPADNDGVWWFSLPGLNRDVQVESWDGACPFLIETDEQCCAEALQASTVDQAVQLIVVYLTAASKQAEPIFINAERFWQ